MSTLNLHLGKTIQAICPHKYVGQNSCAHYVSHVLGLQLGILCNLTTRKEPGRTSIRVNEIFNALPRTGLWEDRPHVPDQEKLLIFITSAQHVSKTGFMSDHPQKHMGICISEKIYNYSNRHHRVVVDSVSAFFDKCDQLYEGDDITLYYGVAS